MDRQYWYILNKSDFIQQIVIEYKGVFLLVIKIRYEEVFIIFAIFSIFYLFIIQKISKFYLNKLELKSNLGTRFNFRGT